MGLVSRLALWPAYEHSGRANSLAEAKADLERNWTMWLNAVNS